MKFQSSSEKSFKMYRVRQYLAQYSKDVLGQPANPVARGEEK